MPSLQITVFPEATVVALGDPVLEEVITISGTHALSTVIPGTKKNRRVRIFADTDCFVTWGTNPTALIDGSEGRMIGAGNPEYFGIEAGFRISVIERV